MSGHYRVAAPSAQVGQPEVKLGLIPGAGGTQRLPRLAGVAKAVEMCTDGNPVKAPDALKAGIVDQLIEGDLLKGAVAFARQVAAKPAPKTRERNQKLGAPEQNAPIFAAARETARKKQRNLIAPLAAIAAIEAATSLPFERRAARSRPSCSSIVFTPTSRRRSFTSSSASVKSPRFRTFRRRLRPSRSIPPRSLAPEPWAVASPWYSPTLVFRSC